MHCKNKNTWRTENLKWTTQFSERLTPSSYLHYKIMFIWEIFLIMEVKVKYFILNKTSCILLHLWIHYCLLIWLYKFKISHFSIIQYFVLKRHLQFFQNANCVRPYCISERLYYLKTLKNFYIHSTITKIYLQFL